MQQLATQRSEIAALPMSDVTAGQSKSVVEGERSSFGAFFEGEKTAVASALEKRHDGNVNDKSLNASKSSDSNTADRSNNSAKTDSANNATPVEQQTSHNNADAKPPEANTNNELKVTNRSEQSVKDDPMPADASDDNSASAKDDTDYLGLVTAIRDFIDDNKLPHADQIAVHVDGQENSELLTAQQGLEPDQSTAEAELSDIAADGDASAVTLDTQNSENQQQALTTQQQAEQLLQQWLAALPSSDESPTMDSSEIADVARQLQKWLVAMTQTTSDESEKSSQIDVNALPDELTQENIDLSINAEVGGSASDGAFNSQQALALLQAIQKLTASDKPVTAIDANQTPTASEAASEILIADAKLLAALVDKTVSANGNAASSGTPNSSTQQNAASQVIAGELDSKLTVDAQLTEMPDSAMDELAQSITERVVSVLPGLTQEQQSAVKGHILSGLQEMKAQMLQGHEPAIDVKGLIAQAVNEQAVTLNADTMKALEQSMNQLAQTSHLGLMAAQQAEHAASSLSQREFALRDASQVQVEQAKHTLQQENIDKPVTIQKQEGQTQMAEKIRWMVNSRQSLAEIRLDPPELGSMQVRVNVQGDSATVSFVVSTAQAKDALAEAVPRLRDMLAEQGIDLGESFVSYQGDGNEQSSEKGEYSGNGSGFDGDDDGTEVVETVVPRRLLGEIDDYA